MKTEHKLGEEFIHNGFTLTTKNTETGCAGCYFGDKPCNDKSLECRQKEREDGKPIIFECTEYLKQIKELRHAIDIQSYAFNKVELMPLTKQLSVSILVDSEINFILHSAKLTPQEVGKDLNEQYERHLNTEPERVELKSLVSIPFKCPNMEDSCPFVDTMTATLDMNCSECKNNIKVTQ